MNILVVSDFHMGNGDCSDIFGWKEEEFLEILNGVIKNKKIDKVILNGDIYELYKYKLDEIIKTNPKLHSYLQNEKFVYIKGNHDAFNKYGLNNYIIRNSAGQSIYIEHGHNAGFINGTTFGRFLCLVGFWLLSFIIKYPRVLNIYKNLVKAIDDVDRIPRKYNTYKYLKYAMQLLKVHDVVILSHTHRLESHKIYFMNNKKRYLNTGCCSLGRFQGIILDTETLKYDSIRISRKQIQKNKGNKKLRVVRMTA